MIARYLFFKHLGVTLLVLALVSLAIFLGQFGDSARYLGGDHDAPAVLLMWRALLRTPALFQYVLPHVMAISTAITLQRMGSQFELAVMSGTGLPAVRIVAPLAVSGIVIGAVYAFALGPVASLALDRAERLERQELGIRVEVHSQQLALETETGTLYVFADAVSADGDWMRDVTVIELDDRHRLVQRIYIARIERGENGDWRVAAELATPTTAVARPDPEALPFDPELLLRRLPPRQMIPVYALPDAVAFAQATAAEPLRYAYQFHVLIALPALLGAVSFAAGALGFSPLNRRPWGWRVVEVLVIAFPIYVVTTVLDAAALRDLMAPATAAWSAPAALMAAGLALLWIKRV